MPQKQKLLERRLQRAIFARSLLVQAWWNFEGMQNLGFLFGLSPLLKRLYPDPAAYRQAAYRHLGYFNTNPYMSGYILGVVAGLEEDLQDLPESKKAAAEKKIEMAKKMMGSSAAAMGDSFFWGSLRPACAAVALLLWVGLWTLDISHPVLIGCAGYLALYNGPALWVRWKGLGTGYAFGETAPGELKKLKWRNKSRWVRRLGLVSAAAVAAGALLVPPWGSAAGLGNAAILAAVIGLRAAQVSTVKAYAAAIVIGAGMALV